MVRLLIERGASLDLAMVSIHYAVSAPAVQQWIWVILALILFSSILCMSKRPMRPCKDFVSD